MAKQNAIRLGSNALHTNLFTGYQRVWVSRTHKDIDRILQVVEMWAYHKRRNGKRPRAHSGLSLGDWVSGAKELESFARDYRSVAVHDMAHDDESGPTAAEVRYCEAEGIPIEEYFIEKYPFLA